MKMVPAWLKIQKLSLLFYLATGVLLLIYALGFISDVYIFYAFGSRELIEFYESMQKVNDALLWKAVFVIIFTVVLLMLELAKHPAGLITLLIVIIIAAVSIFICANSFIVLAQARYDYTALDLSSLDRYIERGAITYNYSTLIYDLGLGGYALFLLSSLFMAITVTLNAFKVHKTVVNEKEGK